MITILNEDDLIEGTGLDERIIRMKTRFHRAVLESDLVIVLGKEKFKVIKDRHNSYKEATYDIKELASIMKKALSSIQQSQKSQDLTPKRLDLVEQEVQHLISVLHQRNESDKKLRSDVESLRRQLISNECHIVTLEETLKERSGRTNIKQIREILDRIEDGIEW